MNPITFEPDAPAGGSLAALLAWFKSWLSESAPANTVIPWKGIHDEGTYLTSWREYHLHAGDPDVVSYATRMLASADGWLRRHLVHGYWRVQEVHHGVEHFIIFLAWIHEMDPAEPLHARQLRDASANIVDTGSKRLRWYDPGTNRFTSLYLGTKFVGFKKGLNIAEHLRLIRLAWLGLACGGNTELSTIITRYSREWASQVVSGPEIPLYLGEFTEADPKRRSANEAAFNKDARAFTGAAPKDINEVTRAEIHVANGTPGLFLALHDATGDPLYLDAAERVVRTTIRNIASPYAHPAGELAWHLHRAGRLPGLAEASGPVREGVDRLAGAQINITLQPGVKWRDTRYYNTVGMRKDMPAVEATRQDTGQQVELPSPATLGLLYRLTGRPGYLRLALDYALAILEAARHAYPDGRQHGCGARAIHAFCVGHGRNWGAGYASTALRAALGEDSGEIALPPVKLG
ncbi:MAG: hypothetical protein JW839_20905 [Candidatus Lokiarchaeota archaeon]|nr:hypothetical protein [Candidatus Lokiarchaeota archaeon]